MFRRLAFFLLAASFAAGAACAEPTPLARLPDDAVPLAYALDLRIDPDAARFGGRARIRVRLARAADHVWLHARELDIARAETVDGSATHRAARVEPADASGVIRVDFGALLPAQDLDLSFEYSAPFNTKLQGLYKVKVGRDAYVVSQMEAVSARYAFPGFDEPRFKTPFDVTLTVPRAAVAIANTRPRRETDAGGGFKTITYATTKPLPTYLVAFAVGPWDVVDAPDIPPNAVRRRALPLRAIGARGTAAQLRWILGETPAIVAFFEDYTQQPFPFDKLDLLGAPDFSAGAMENAGLVVFRDALLRLDATSPAGTARSIFDVTAHELAHQWFGDLVTVPWWDDIWLNEAFASWAQGKATAALKPEYLADLNRLEGTFGAMANDALLSARRIRQPVAGQDEIENAFDGITYRKGAAVLRMIEGWIGADVHRAAMRAYLARHAYGSGSSADLVATLAAVSGKGDALVRVMRSFLDQPGIPLLQTALTCRGGNATLAVAQSRDLPFGVMSQDRLQWHVPLCARFGRGAATAARCFLVDRPRQSFAVAGRCPDWYLPNADAAGYYRFTMPEREFAALGAQVAALAPAEQMIYADAIRGAFARGELTPAAVLDAMPPLAASPLPQVAFALSGNLVWMREHLATDATRPLLDAFAHELYAARLAALGYDHRAGESDADSRLRQRLVALLALDMHDADVRRVLAERGGAMLGVERSGGAQAAADAEREDSARRHSVREHAIADRAIAERSIREHPASEHPVPEHSIPEHSIPEHSIPEHSVPEHPGTVDLVHADPDLRGFALKVAVQDLGAPAFDAVLAELQRTTQTQQRYELVSALGAAREPALAARARDLGLSPTIAVGELSRLYAAQVAEPENRDAFWDWYRAHFDALRARYPDAYQRSLPRLPATGRCTRTDADALQAWFAPRAASIIGGPRALAQALETISQCAALRDHLPGDALAAWAESRR